MGPLLAVPGVETVPGVPLFDELPADEPLASAPEDADWPGLVEPDGAVDVGLLGGGVEPLEEAADGEGVVDGPVVVGFVPAVVFDVLSAEPLRPAPPLIASPAPPVARIFLVSVVLAELVPDCEPAVPLDEVLDPADEVRMSDRPDTRIPGADASCAVSSALATEARTEAGWRGAGVVFVTWADALGGGDDGSTC